LIKKFVTQTLMPQPADQPRHSRVDDSDAKQAKESRPIREQGLLTRLRHRRITPRLVLVYATSLVLLWLASPWVVTFLVGSALVVAGLMLRIWTFGHLQKNKTLTTTGPYAHTRNPAYVGSALIMTGMFTAAGDPFSALGIGIWVAGLIGLVVFFAGYMPRKYRREYGNLLQRFPDQVERHAAHVPNFFPRLTPWRSGDTHRFSWQCWRQNHEWVWPVVCVSALILMWL
jgi:protein-S-isoprenylcysteine O-methyltransferase Ste14